MNVKFGHQTPTSARFSEILLCLLFVNINQPKLSLCQKRHILGWHILLTSCGCVGKMNKFYIIRWLTGLKQALVSGLETRLPGSSCPVCHAHENSPTNMKADNYKLPFPLAFGAQIFGDTVSSEPAGVKEISNPPRSPSPTWFFCQRSSLVPEQ